MRRKLLIFFLFFSYAVVAQNRIPEVSKSTYKNHSIAESGLWCGVEISGGVSVAHSRILSSTFPIGVEAYVGYRVCDLLKVGFGTGFRYYFENSSSRYYMNNMSEYEDYGWSFPMFFNVRGLMMPGRSRNILPYWSASIGYTINDGFVASPSLGLSFGSMERSHFLLALGYVAQRTELCSDNKVGHRKGFLNIIQLKLGYEF